MAAVPTHIDFEQKLGAEPLPEPKLDPSLDMLWIREPINDLDEGAWVLSEQWAGFMGAALKFNRDGTFKYWFYSDVKLPDEPKWPIVGSWAWNGPVLELKVQHHLFDARWYAYRHKNELTLLPEHARRWQLDKGEANDDRLLFRVNEFDEDEPFASQWAKTGVDIKRLFPRDKPLDPQESVISK